MKINLTSKISSRLSITPQLQNAIKLLQMSAVEINQEIQNIFESNPLIEKEDSAKIMRKIIVRALLTLRPNLHFSNKTLCQLLSIIEKTLLKKIL